MSNIPENPSTGETSEPVNDDLKKEIVIARYLNQARWRELLAESEDQQLES